MDEPDDFVMGIDDWEVLEAGLVKPVKGEWTDDFVVADINNLVGREHNRLDFSMRKINYGGNGVTFTCTEDAMRRAFDDIEEFGDRSGRKRFDLENFGRVLLYGLWLGVIWGEILGVGRIFGRILRRNFGRIIGVGILILWKVSRLLSEVLVREMTIRLETWNKMLGASAEKTIF